MSSWIKWKTQTTGEPASIVLTHSDLQFLANCVLFPCRRTVHDKQTGSDIVLSDEQVELVNRLQKGQFGDVNFNEYEVRSPWWKYTWQTHDAVLTVVAPLLQPQVEFFSNEVMIHPVTNRPEHKRSFIPSLVEKEKVSKLVHAIKMGWIKPRRVDDDSRGPYYDLWAGEDSSILAKHRMHLPAPKTPLPGHHESYNPPPEYLLTDEEVGAHRHARP